ncbi:MAG: penicillin-binding transpeptidase domain-containing protein [Thermodesulfobacteriota bacterium]|nr:penicillin-binding transpeptidase domain-containing protein [Thermodesulfobacteriota bacterium]
MKDCQKPKSRKIIIYGAIFLAAGMIILFYLSGKTLLSNFLARDQQQKQTTDDPVQPDAESLWEKGGEYTERYNIYDRNFKKLAVSFKLTSIYARPLEIKGPEQAAERLASVLDLDERELVSDLKSERNFVWLGRRIPADTAVGVIDLDLPGVSVFEELYRYYPNHRIASHVVGFVNDEQGLAGMEFHYDNILRGEPVDDPVFFDITTAGSGVVGKAGGHLVLTLDLPIQKLLEDRLRSLRKKTKASSGMVMVMNPSTGSILGLVSLPSYDPNRFWDYGPDELKNRIITDPVMPGGLNGLFDFAAAIEAGSYIRQLRPETGDVKVLRGHGGDAEDDTEAPSKEEQVWIQIRDRVFISPEARWQAVNSADEEGLDRFLFKIGFNRKSGVDLPVERQSSIMEDTGEVGHFQPEYHTSSTTALHLLSAFSRLVNGGKAITPHLLDAVWDEKSEQAVTALHENDIAPVYPEVSAAVLTMLEKAGKARSDESLFVESIIANQFFGEPDVTEPHISPLDEQQADSKPKVSSESADPEPEAGREETIPESGRFHCVMLGMAPRKNPVITMVVVLDNAFINLKKPSCMRKMGQEIISKIAKIAGQTPPGNGASLIRSGESEAPRKWLEFQNRADAGPDLWQTSIKKNMPDVTGRSLRKALQELQSYGLKVKIRGFGRVVAQEPKAGSVLNGMDCILHLAPGTP